MKYFKLLSILGLLALAGYWLFGGWPPGKPKLNLGLDLVGGAQMIFQAQTSPEVPKIDDRVMQGLVKVFQNRVNASGTTEAVVQRVGKDRILVEIPGANPQKVKRRLLQTAHLEFRLLNDQGKWVPSGVSGKDLEQAQASATNTGQWVINFELKPAGSREFSRLTRKLAKTRAPLGIFLDGELISAPRVNSQIVGSGQITGDFSPEEARDLAVQLNAGALPAPVKLISERAVSATLGAQSLHRSLTAGVAGLSAIAAFMVAVYRLPGMLAVLALAAYVWLTLGIFAQVVTLTLAGIAGFILSIGMAVDANVLIFERVREELLANKTIFRAVNDGFHKAFPSIFDSNLNTLLICAILAVFGTGMVRGFAITLAIGVVVSFFTALVITRSLFNATLTVDRLRQPRFFLPSIGN